MYTTTDTFSVVVQVKDWMANELDSSARVLLNYLEDVASGLDFVGWATACILNTKPVLVFTFINEEDFALFQNELHQIWNDGGWLSDGI